MQEITGEANITLDDATVTATAQAFRPLPDDHPCFALIGLITSECARIEYFLDATIFEFAGLQSYAKRGACITGQMIGMHPRYQALYQLAIECDAPKPLRSEIERLHRLSNDIAQRRNRAVHDSWLGDGLGDPYQFRTKTKKETEYGPSPVPLEKLIQHVRRPRRKPACP